MATIFEDTITFTKDVTFTGSTTQLTLPANGLIVASGSTGATTAGTHGILSAAFVLADIEAGTKVWTTLPAGAIVTGAAVKVTTALAFADGGAGDTTEVTIIVGTSGDDNGWITTTALAGATGFKYQAAATSGAMIGRSTAGGSGNLTATFAASAGSSPDLADVSAGAGTVYITYIVPA